MSSVDAGESNMAAVDRDGAGMQRRQHGTWHCLEWMHFVGRFRSCLARSIAQCRVEWKSLCKTQVTEAYV